MGRPTVYGKQLVVRNGRFIGINIGYNFYMEHECGTEEICDDMNRLWEYKGIGGKMVLRKLAKEPLRYKDTPFGKYMLLPNVAFVRWTAVIDNSQCEFQARLMQDGVWDMLYIGVESSLGSIMKRKHKFIGNKGYYYLGEANIFYMQDYNVGDATRIQNDTGIVGSWGSGCDYILLGIMRGYTTCDVLSQISLALRAGHLAVCPGDNRLFYDRGCCIVDVQAGYGF